jgi:hypothetical protein
MEELVIIVLRVLGEFALNVLLDLPFLRGWMSMDRRRRERARESWRGKGPTLASSADTTQHLRAKHSPWPQSDDSPWRSHLFAWGVWLCAGILIGGLISLVWPHTFLPHPALRLANLVLAPWAAGLVAEWIARQRANSDPDIDPRRAFWLAFWFALGLAGARLTGLR